MLPHTMRSQLAAVIVVCTLTLLPPALNAQIGIFSHDEDIGTVLHPGSARFDAASGSYTIAGSGDNMWFGVDDFHFVWKKMSGDVSLTADISFVGSTGNAHRKAALMLRQMLEPGSPYVDVARHGDGLTSLQYRDTPNADTHEIESYVSAPQRVRIVKRGDYAYVFVSDANGNLVPSGAAMRVNFTGDFYVGLGVCSHDKDVTETAIFSHVKLEQPPPATAKPVLYSTLETITVASTDRRVRYVTPALLTSPQWSPDAASLLFHRDGELYRLPLNSTQPVRVNAARDDNEAQKIPQQQTASSSSDGSIAHVSPDGKWKVSLVYVNNVTGEPANQDVELRLMSLTTKEVHVLAKLLGGMGTIDLPSWSPDSTQLTFVSYELLPQ